MSTKILEAVRNSQYSQLLLFLKHNYNFKIRSMPDGSNVLMIALEIQEARKRFKMFKFLLDNELVDILETNCAGATVFFIAVQKQCYDELELLMSNYHSEIDWRHLDNMGKSILHHAVSTNNLNVLELLLNYCAKYKINVDIPDRDHKITPYLLACRLNNHKAADLLVKIGHASRNQADQNVFYDAERWKQEGQVEMFKNYLKSKEQEMSIAKLNGRMKVYKELNVLSSSLDSEVYKNPDILPILAKVIIDHGGSNNNASSISKISTTGNSSNSNSGNSSGATSDRSAATAASKQQRQQPHRVYSSSPSSAAAAGKLNKLPPIYLKANTNGFVAKSKTFINNQNQPPFNHQHHHHLLSNSSPFSSSSGASSGSPRSSASSSKLSTIYNNRYQNSLTNSSEINNNNNNNSNIILTDLNSVLKHTMNTLIKERNNQSPQVNSLLEMTNGRLVENFVGSKSESDAALSTSTSSSHPHAAANSTHASNSSSHGTSNHGSSSHGPTHHSIDIANIFLAAAMEKTSNYRATAKINNEPIVPRIVKAPKPKKASSLAIIREESRVSTFSKKSKAAGYKTKIVGEGLRKSTKSAVKVAN